MPCRCSAEKKEEKSVLICGVLNDLDFGLYFNIYSSIDPENPQKSVPFLSFESLPYGWLSSELITVQPFLLIFFSDWCITTMTDFIRILTEYNKFLD